MRQFLRDIYLRSFGLFKAPKPGIHILNGHYVTPSYPSATDSSIFRSFLEYLTKKCRLIDFQEATRRIVNNDFPTEKAYIAFSFDDGYEECHTTIAPLLEEYNCNAAFFINANYVDSSSEYREGYHRRVNINTKRPMNWMQITDLHERGHIIGAHTLDHLNLSALNQSQLDYQFAQNKKVLEEHLKYTSEYFAWPYGQFQHFNQNVLEVALKYHKYIFSATDHHNYFSMGRKALNRRHIEPFWPKSHIDYFLSVEKKN